MRSRNEILEKQLQSWFQTVDLNDSTTAQKGLVFGAAAQLYRATQDAFYLDYVHKGLNPIVKQDGSITGLDGAALTNLLLGNVLYFLSEQTGDARYETAAVKLACQLDTQERGADAVFVCSDGKMNLADAYCSQVFYMNYETRNGGKERYNDIIAQYNGIRKNLYGDVQSRLNTDWQAREEAAYYAAALIDTMEVMEQPIYEIYRRLQDLFKEAVGDLLSAAMDENGCAAGSCAGNRMLSYAILKGCRMKALHTEKYEAKALELLDEAVEQLLDDATASKDAGTKETAALALAYSESIKNREYQDYGRNKGGRLWS